MSAILAGRLDVVGLGPGPARWATPAVTEIFALATDLVGYKPYLDRVPRRAGQIRHASDNRAEGNRARHALTLAAMGRHVAVVSGGDPGVFAMASAVCEAIAMGGPDWATLDVRFEPGVTAMLAAAAKVGAPLGGDFCAISLSDNLKPWGIIETRVRAAASADFVICFYNPVSQARPDGLRRALTLVGEGRTKTAPVVFARAVGRAEETISVVSLGDAASACADMSTLVIVGASGTRLIERPGRPALVYTERFMPPVIESAS